MGVLRKEVLYKGVSAHAGDNPSAGINALYAATLGLQAINSLRETFKDEDLIRVHPIITKGGTAVNAIPSDVKIESYVRGKTLDAISHENKKRNRAQIGAAVSMGANIEIIDQPGYYPLNNDINMIEITKTAMEYIMGREHVQVLENHSTLSTDMGDLSAVMPVVHPYMPGATGTAHGSDYFIVNPQNACINSAKVQLIMLNLLLANNASKAKYIIENKKVSFKTKEEYFSHIKSLEGSGDRIEYISNSNIKVIL